MPRPGLLLPTLQNWACHNCGGCCREHLIAVTPEEQSRIQAQGWSEADGIPTGRPLFVAHGSGFRINHQSDGACVFLDPQGLCRIHSRFGEAAKPLACRLYPYAIHPSGHLITTSLRFSCPSVVQNLGPPVALQRAPVEALAAEVVPAAYHNSPAPSLRRGLEFDWPRMTRLLAWIERGLSAPDVSFPLRLQRLLTWTGLLGRAEPEALSETHFGELVKVLYEAAARALPMSESPSQKPSSLARLMFRQLIAVLLRHDTAAQLDSGLSGRLANFSQGLRFSFALGRIPDFPDPESVRVAFVERRGTAADRAKNIGFVVAESPLQEWDATWDDLFVRYFHVKLQGLHFCGPAFYDYPVITGLQSLALMLPAVMWTARVRAAREQRTAVRIHDIQAALAVLDHNFGYSPALGLKSSQRRIEQLAAMEQLVPLVAWYCRTT